MNWGPGEWRQRVSWNEFACAYCAFVAPLQKGFVLYITVLCNLQFDEALQHFSLRKELPFERYYHLLSRWSSLQLEIEIAAEKSRRSPELKEFEREAICRRLRSQGNSTGLDRITSKMFNESRAFGWFLNRRLYHLPSLHRLNLLEILRVCKKALEHYYQRLFSV